MLGSKRFGYFATSLYQCFLSRFSIMQPALHAWRRMLSAKQMFLSIRLARKELRKRYVPLGEFFFEMKVDRCSHLNP